MAEQAAVSYPCGKKEMEVIACPKCFAHFGECANKSRGSVHENVMAFMELSNKVAVYEAEKAKRLQQRAKARRLAQSILRKREQIKAMQKELGKIFYDDGLNSPFSFTERGSHDKNEVIRKALRD